jgi:hypothetical protein
MHHLVAKLDALDPEAGAAIRVISRFDELVEGHAGLGPILCAVATLSGLPSTVSRDSAPPRERQGVA